MKASFPSVTVVMPVRNEQQHLPKAVESVLAQKYPGQLEIILAIAPSVDETQLVANELAKKYSGIKLIQNPAGLTTVGLNLAIAESSGEIIVRVDAHSDLANNYITRGVEILRETGSVLIGGIMNARGESPLQKAVAFGYGSRLGLGGGTYHVGGRAGEAESAYLGIFDARALKEVSGYNENIIRGEDWDLAQRLKASGGKVWFSPELIVNYAPRSNIKALAWQFYSTGVWRGELTRRAPTKASIRYLIPPVALLALIDLVLLTSFGFLNQVALIIPIASYLLLLTIGAGTARGLGILDRMMIFIALPVMHLSWATGFWVGLILGAKKIVDAGDKK